jgi:hypothetical protein
LAIKYLSAVLFAEAGRRVHPEIEKHVVRDSNPIIPPKGLRAGVSVAKKKLSLLVH